jgi:hypothetical protein
MAIFWVGTGRFQGYIGPVQDYIDRVVAADVAAGNTLGLEVGVRDAYDVFIRDSIDVGDLGTSGGVLSQANSIIKAAPIMAGAQTLQGALVPLVGSAPTNFNFVSGDYNRKTGLVGDGSTKYLDTGYSGATQPLDNMHACVNITTAPTGNTAAFGYSINLPGAVHWLSGGLIRCQSLASVTDLGYTNGFVGLSRNSSTAFQRRTAGATTTVTLGSDGRRDENYNIFRRGNANPTASDARIAFYSIGESLDLALLDARVTALINAIAAAI